MSGRARAAYRVSVDLENTDAPYRPSTGEMARWFRQAVRDVGVRGLLRARRAARDAEGNVDLNAETPENVGLDARSYAMLQHALDLAADEREDDEAVAELTHLADRRRRTLQVAALGARQRGEHRDYEVPNRAHRLLQAALTGRPVAPVSESEQQRFDVLDAFTELERVEQWRELVEHEPRLADLERDAQAGHYATTTRAVQIPTLAPEQRAHAAAELLRVHNELDARLRPLVGPDSGNADILLGSQAAFDAACDYLDQLSDAKLQ